MRKLVNYLFNELDSHSFATLFTIIYFMATLLLSILVSNIINESYIWCVGYWIVLSYILSFKLIFILDTIQNAVDKYLK